ncbi:cell division protein FtsL [Sedimentibacter acidaminivorans]|uniref:Cell division protein FtsL n=1 Tax=Sedimentibacter acidaminivorans TaxID=913099 RepID=A0ABS4GCK3_9FIRM|nr:hypothetical protein [Sedimentibacter acidaminivorans]MBP1925413.1 cell division protein FtsL [Sedimentibacter acidaminivorans]
MNRIMKKIILTEYKRLIYLIIIFVVSLFISALIFVLTGQGSMNSINYENISQLPLMTIFLKNFKRNIVYFISIICLTFIGQSKIINGLFGLISVYYGLSVIYLVKTINFDKIYFILTFTDYFVFFPILFYFTYISSVVSKYSKKSKKVETISCKFDIIMSSYIKLALLFLIMVSAYSLGYSYYISILSRLLVK